MPKQFTFSQGTEMRITPDVPVYRPHLGIDIARVATYWSELEFNWAIAYTYLLRGKDEFAIYYDTRDWYKRRRLFTDAVDAAGLSQALKDEGNNLYADFEKLANERNRVVHGTWAWCPQHDQSIFLAQPRNLGNQIIRVFTAVKNVATRPQQYPQVSVDLSRATYDEYRHEDFEDIVKQMAALRTKIMEYGNRIAAHSLGAISKTLTPTPQNTSG